MTTPRCTMAAFVGLCWLFGCVAPTNGPDANTVRGRQTSQTPEDEGKASAPTDAEVGATHESDTQTDVCKGRQIQRVEESWDDGTPKLWQEIVVDENGNQVPHGLTTQFWDNGQKKLEMQYDCGVRHGPRHSWYEDGSQWAVGEFLNGKDHGTWTVWYSDGSKSQEFTMIEGAWHGKHTVWHPNGKVRSEVVWDHGRRQGPVRYWDEYGNLIKEDHYVDNIRQPMPRPAPPEVEEPDSQ
ncbi:MAG: toxin-antitoxin system YwqK family antitoxin [Phycisphaerales bacterium]|nr:MAG: toxin-antitoxin system YwqK family antitoxin [Phycisphaerales bacterium]